MLGQGFKGVRSLGLQIPSKRRLRHGIPGNQADRIVHSVNPGRAVLYSGLSRGEQGQAGCFSGPGGKAALFFDGGMLGGWALDKPGR